MRHGKDTRGQTSRHNHRKTKAMGAVGGLRYSPQNGNHGFVAMVSVFFSVSLSVCRVSKF